MDCKLRAKNCGGCPMLATEYAAQLKKKEADVRALLGKYGPVAPIRGMEESCTISSAPREPLFLTATLAVIC